MRAGFVIAGAALAAGAYVYYRRSQDEQVGPVADAMNDAAQQTAELIDSLTGGTMKLSAMAKVTAAMVNHPNVQAFRRVIRRGEGTSDEGGYSRLYGGGKFEGFADHPRRKITAGKYTSTAAGAYQALTSTWDETKRIMKLPDFSPRSQDWFAVGRIAARGALDDVMAGRFEAAIRKCAYEWASLPYSPYGQPVISMATASSVYAQNGGTINA
jgi:muramidase (phage lysozyme)